MSKQVMSKQKYWRKQKEEYQSVSNEKLGPAKMIADNILERVQTQTRFCDISTSLIQYTITTLLNHVTASNQN